MCTDDNVTVTHDLVKAESVRKIILPAKDLQRKKVQRVLNVSLTVQSCKSWNWNSFRRLFDILTFWAEPYQ